MRCQFEDCQNEQDLRTAIIDKETLRDIFICKECYKNAKENKEMGK